MKDFRLVSFNEKVPVKKIVKHIPELKFKTNPMKFGSYFEVPLLWIQTLLFFSIGIENFYFHEFSTDIFQTCIGGRVLQKDRH